MRITKIERQKKNHSRRSIYLEDKYAFGVSEDVYLKLGLHEEQELTESEIEAIRQTETEQSVKSAALRFRSYRPRSQKEIEDYLHKKGFEDKYVKAGINYLHSQQLLNDEEFARMFCRDRLALKPVGKLVMKNQLLKRGIAKPLIEKIIGDYYTADKEEALARKEAEKKFLRIRKLPPLVQKQRIYNHLLRKGYDSSLSLTIIKQLINDNA